MMTTSKKRSVPLSQSTEKTAKRRKRTYFSDEQLDRLEQTFGEDMFPGIDKRETLARELGIGEDRIHVWFQNRRSRWRKREIKNKPAPVTNHPQLQTNHRLEPWVPDQFLPYCHPSNFLPTSGAAHVSSCDNILGINSSSYYFPSQFPATNTAHSSAFTGPLFSFIYAPVSPPTSSQITTTEQAPYSDQGSQRVSPLFYDSDSTESRHSSDEYLAAMGLLSVFNREN